MSQYIIDLFTVVGAIFVFAFLITAVTCIIGSIVKTIKIARKNKRPIAKSYCKHCVYFFQDTRICSRFKERKAMDFFCAYAEPATYNKFAPKE